MLPSISLYQTSLHPHITQNPSNNTDDSIWKGDNMLRNKPDHTTRLLFHNVNGIKMQGSAQSMDFLVHEQKALEVDLQGISEHCLDTTKITVQQTLYQQLQKEYPGQSVLQINSSASLAVNTYKPGGTAIIAIGDIVGRLALQGKGGDSMGRWSFFHLKRQNQPHVTIFSVYQVCPKPTNLQGTSAWHQQRLALNLVNRDREHPRHAFITDLLSTIKQFQHKGHDIIVGGDFNESIEDTNSGILRLATNANLTDPWRCRYPSLDNFATQASGRKRIDSIFISHRLYPFISGIGYGPFGSITNSDHRPLLIDFNSTQLFGDNTSALRPPTFRPFKLRDRQAVTTFIEETHGQLLLQNAFSMMEQLEDANHQTVELLDAILGKAEAYGVKKCSKRRPEFYSTALAKARLTVSLLYAHRNDLRLVIRSRLSALQARAERAGLILKFPPGLQETNANLKLAKEALRKCSNNHIALRDTEKQAQIEYANTLHETKKARRLQSIKKQENQRNTYSILQSMKRKTGQQPKLDHIDIPASWPPPTTEYNNITKLEDPKQCQAWQTITDPEQIEFYIILRNRLHFGQAQGTPFTIDPLRSSLDWAASTADSDSLLAGSFLTTHSTPQVSALLDSCTVAAKLDLIPAEITLTEFEGKLRSWREDTSTSLASGRDLSRYKSLLAKSKYDPDTNPIAHSTFVNLQKDISNVKLAIINYCLRTGYILHRWKTIVNVMIFKEPGNYRIHRLRVIHIYEADYNLVLAIKWRQLMVQANTQGLLHPGQYGGRPGCEAQFLTLLEELKYDISYASRRSLINFDNDAMSCYDRIILSLASLINRKYGQHRKVVLVHAQTLESARYRLKLSDTLSATEYSHSIHFPIHGSGQGSGNSPSIWLFISSTLFDVHATQAHGSTFISPDGKIKARITMVGFVDDTTGSCNDFQAQTQEPIAVISQRMQADAQVWQDLLYASGGGLELSKSSYHTLHFKFSPRGAPLPILHAHEGDIHLRESGTNRVIPIQSKRADEAHKTLGHYKSPADHKQRAQLRDIEQKARRQSVLIGTSPISRAGATLAYHSILIPTIKYPLPQSFFDAKTLAKAESRIMGIIFSKCGYHRNMSHILLYTPTSYAGGGFVRWYTLQGEGQITNFLKHWRTNTVISDMLRIDLAWSQWQAGLSQSILKDTTTSLPHLESRWIKSLREFLAHLNGTITINTDFVPRPERFTDIYIMEYAQACNEFTATELKIINFCRLYLHVTTVSELFDSTGTKILPDMLACRRSLWFDPSVITTIQNRPSSYQIRYQWQRLLRHWCQTDGTIARSISLGRWRPTDQKLRLRRSTYFVPKPTTVVYHWHQGCYWDAHPTILDPTHFVLQNPTEWSPTVTAIPIEVVDQGTFLTLTSRCTKCPTDDQIPFQNSTFHEYIATLEEWEQSILQNINFLETPETIMKYIQYELLSRKERVLIVSDGSVLSHHMTFGWVFGTTKGRIFAENKGPGCGVGSSHRGEGWGALSGVRFLHHLSVYTATQIPTRVGIRSISDNEGLITGLVQRREYQECYANSTLTPDWDILEQIHHTIAGHNLKHHHYVWVKGHQDDTNAYDNLSVEARFNIRADELAEEYMAEDFWVDRRISPLLPAAKCSLQINGMTHHAQYTKIIRHAVSIPPLLEYLRKKFNWSNTVTDDIDWDLFQLAANNYQMSDNHLLKLVYDQLPTRKHKSKFEPWVAPQCHYCAEEETFQHLLRCTNPLSAEFGKNLIANVRIYLQRAQAPEGFTTMMEQALKDWLQVKPVLQLLPTVTRMHNAIHAQTKIGWSYLMKGFLSKQWTKYLYNHHLRMGHSTTTTTVTDAPKLLSGLIHTIWKTQSTFWHDHLKHIHQSTTTHSTSPDKILEVQAQIRTLHERRNEALASHQREYFHEDVESYLNHATGNQMTNYLKNYGPAILKSIKDAKQWETATSVLQFRGFNRQLPPDRTPIPRLPLTHVNNEVPAHRKKGRWRPSTTVLTAFRNFFRPNPHS